MKKSTFAFAVVGVIVIALAGSYFTFESLHDQGKRTKAAWKDVYGTSADMSRGVDVIAVVRHVGTSPGRVAYSANAQDSVPFELNHFVVERSLKGARPGSSLTVERVGGRTAESAVLLDADGGPYVAGQRYVLFLNKQNESDFYYLVNDEGRYVVGRGERLMPVTEAGAVANELRETTVADLAERVRIATRNRDTL